MCTTNPAAAFGAMPNPSKEFTSKEGDRCFIDGEEYRVTKTNQSYLKGNNADPTARYASLRRIKDNELFIITHKRFCEVSVKELQLPERWITPDQILRAEPCGEGVFVLAALLGLGTNFTSQYSALKSILQFGNPDKSLRVNALYDAYVGRYSATLETSWLLFIAKVLKLVPEQSQGPDRLTLMRLLGIK